MTDVVHGVMNLLQGDKPKIRELDPTMTQRLKEASYLVRIISETEIAERKCGFYSGIASEKTVVDFFEKEAKKLGEAKRLFQDYYESMTKE